FTTVVFAVDDRDGVTYNGVTYYLPQTRDKIELPAGLPDTVTVNSGDTLWGLSSTHLKDPFLWPLLWENNMEEVQNPHLIYPGQVIKLPKSGMVIPTQAAQAPGGFEEAAQIGADGQPIPLGEGEMTVTQYIESQRIPMATDTDRETCGYITKETEEVGSIVASENPSLQLSINDIVYVNIGEDDNVKAGDIFTVFIYARKVMHPHNKDYLGQLVKIKGRVKILCTQKNSSTAIISKAYDSMSLKDKLKPYIPTEMQYREDPPETTFCDPSSGELPGVIVDVSSGGEGLSDSVIIAEQNVIYIDRGSNEGVAVGQYYATFARVARGIGENEDTKVYNISNGEAIIIGVKEKTATALVTKSSSALYIGDLVDLKK
ncbi:LysM peptidoglycan-binding domain-containing protein, partial [candidate division CSSED10-310 bacterium]